MYLWNYNDTKIFDVSHNLYNMDSKQPRMRQGKAEAFPSASKAPPSDQPVVAELDQLDTYNINNQQSPMRTNKPT